jgi:hypothetical protein
LIGQAARIPGCYAQTLLDLRAALNFAPDDRSRRRLLRELRRLLSTNVRH